MVSMRLLIATLLLTVPLSGCISGVGVVDTGELFDYIEVERGDPEPVPYTTCQELLTALNLRSEQHALVRLHQDYQYMFEHRRFFGGATDDDVMMETAEDSGSSDMAASAPQESGSQSAGDGAAHNAADAEVTGTNNQEQGVDEADIIKTDGVWTYAIDGRLLQIMHSSTVGNLTLHSTVELGDGSGYGYGTQLLLVDRGNDDPSDDRLVVIMTGVRDPDPEEPKRDGPKEAYHEEPGMSADIAYSPYYGGSFSRVIIYDLADRQAPTVIADHYIEGNHVAARLVDGIVYTVIHHNEPYLDLRTWAGPDDETLREEGMDREDYHEASEARQKEILRQSVRNAIAHNEEVLNRTTLDDYLPRQYHDGREAGFTEAYCASVLSTMDDMGRSVSTIFSIDADADDLDFDSTAILGGYPLVYGAQDALVLASRSQETWWFWAQPDLDEATNLHWFDLDGLEVSHRASGRVDGTVQDQFGIDVHNDQLRIVTTTGNWGRWWVEDPDPMQNHLFVFDEVEGLLVPSGSVTGFAEDERIWSARFTDDRAYVVTFEQIDPLWIIDLTDPTDPEILGELEIPGVSTYIHPLPGEEALLTIGLGPRYAYVCDGDDGSDRAEPVSSDGSEDDPRKDDPDCREEAVGLDWSRIQVSLFDIRDTSDPVRADVFDVTLPESEYNGDDGFSEYSWGYSSALHEHKAFTYWDAIGMLAVPVSWHHYEETRSCEGSRCTRTTTEEFHTGLDLITVDRQNMTLEKYGSVDQDHLMSQEGNEYGWYWGAEVQRSYFLGFPDEYPDKPVSVYAYSSIGISAHDLETLQDQDAVGFRGGEQYYGYYEEDAEATDDEDILDDIPGASA